MKFAQSGKKRLILLLLPLILLMAGAASFLAVDQARPYKKLTLGKIELYVPRALIAEDKADLANMLRDYIGTVELQRFQLSADADKILPPTLTQDIDVASSSVIWTIAEADVERGPLFEKDKALFLGTEPYSDRTLSASHPSGLLKLVRADSSGRSYALVNADPNTATDLSELWVAHCIELSSVTPGRPWGRCTTQFEYKGIKIQIHYDGRIVRNTHIVADTVRDLIDVWLQKPES